MPTSQHTLVAHVPGSKSLTARALFLAAAARGTTRLVSPLVSADTVAFRDSLRAVGYEVMEDAADLLIAGTGAGPTRSGRAWCHDAGTAARFLPALFAAGTGEFVVDASEQMRARPMAPLVTALRDLGVDLDTAPGDRLPFTLRAAGVRGAHLTMDAGTSSQFLTALCLLGPLTSEGLSISVSDIVSVPYVDMTLAMMRDFGAEATRDGMEISIGPTPYTAREYVVEADASTASYFFAAAAITGRTITVPNLGTGSLQGDVAFATEVLPRLGCAVEATAAEITVTGPARLTAPGEVNMRDISDTMMSLAALAPFCDGPTRIVDVANCRVKESDRIWAMESNLRRAGVEVTSGPDWIQIHPGTPGPLEVETFHDHRIAMSFGVAALAQPRGAVTYDQPECVAKTFPEFHEVFAALRDELEV
ncbi:3-phosphoshikimate 1-carboxyvinyltransferase [Micrococcales bacterium 31B]|nr:3-phosphoshikimate 1-carboxyvinyltransferase [Micrococcales bacterium 31B]